MAAPASRRVSAETLACIKRWEGLRLTAYRDVAGTLTIGYGHTGRDVTIGRRITEADAEIILRADLSRFERCVDEAVQTPLTDQQFGALVSFAFNVGEAAFRKSTLLRKLNEGDYAAVPHELLRWTKAGGKQVPGLVNRRNAEIGLWSRGSDVASAPVTPAPPRKAMVSGKAARGAAVGAGGAAVILSQAGDIAGPLTSLRYAMSGLEGWELVVVAAVAVVIALSVWLYARRTA